MAPLKSAGPKSSKAAAFMRKAIQYYETGDLPKAQKNVSKYLSADPRNPDANHLAGLIAHNTGNPETAVKLISRALESNPRMAMAHNNLGESLRALDRFSEAEAAYRNAIELEPAQTGFYNNLGIALLAQDKPDDAIATYETALKRNPRDAMVLTNLGNALLHVGKSDEAVAAHHKALALQPTLVEALSNLGVAYNTIGDLDRARDVLEKALTRQPNHLTALTLLGTIYEAIGEIAKAELMRKRSIEVEPGERDHYLAYADLLRFDGRPEEAAAVFERHLKHEPTCTDSKVQIASVWRSAGQQDRAQSRLREILKSEPDHVAARAVLAQMIKHTPDEENIAGLKALRDKTDLPIGKQASVNFALGKAMEEIDDLDTAISCYNDANRHRRSEFTYGHNETVEQIDKLIDVFTPDAMARQAGNGSGDTTPIFIVGMPRSGTSLVEQIISSHSQVYGAGELSTMAQMIGRVFANNALSYPDALPECPPEIFEAVGTTYVDLVRKRFGDSPRITDKMPHNFMSVGMIRLALPNAKIIHCQRHPMDTCLSIYKNAFSESHNYAYNMKELGEYYREYLRLMAHWRTVMPDALYEIRYEELVDDTETQARALLQHCELEWEPSCLEFYKTKRVVNTVSASQVRQPIYKSSVALWKRYGSRLQPLIDALGDAITADD